MKPYLSVIIPAYNEAKRLPLTLIDIGKHLSKSEFSYEIIVVDNNSTDATSEIVKRFSHLINNLKLIRCNVPGKGAAVQKGILEAGGKIRLFMDADNSTSIDQFGKMIPYFSEGYDVVIRNKGVIKFFKIVGTKNLRNIKSFNEKWGHRDLDPNLSVSSNTGADRST